MQSGPRENPGARRAWRRVLIGVGILAGILVLALAAFVVAGYVRESRAIEAVRSRGEPLTPSEIAFASTEVESDLVARLQRLRAAYDSGAPAFGVWLPGDRADVLDELRAAPAWSAAIEPVERLFDCIGDDERGAKELASTIEARLGDPRRAQALDPCERQILLARGAVEEPLLELALDVCRSAPESGERATRAWTPDQGLDPDPDRTPAFLFVAIRSVSAVAVARAIEGRSTEAIELLGLAFRGASLLREWPSTLECVAANVAWGHALRALRAALPFLPPDADLTGLQSQIATHDPMRALERAILAERAFGNELFAALRDGRLSGSEGGLRAPSGWSGVVVWSMLGHDRATYLEVMGRAAGWPRAPYLTIAADVDAFAGRFSESLALKSAFVTQLLVPRVDVQLRDAATTQAAIGLALAAIRARIDGMAAARSAAAATADPFRDGPLQSRVEEDGTLVLWSVGVDLADQGGIEEDELIDGRVTSATDPADLVWRVQPR